jgi:hypothetical protein
VGVGLHLLSQRSPGRSWWQSSSHDRQPGHPRPGRHPRHRSDQPGGTDADEFSAAEKIGLSAPDPDNSEYRDLDEARRLITALAGLLTASLEFLGPHAKPLKDGLRSLQLAFREASAIPDEPGFGPGEKLTGPLS